MSSSGNKRITVAQGLSRKEYLTIQYATAEQLQTFKYNCYR